MPLRSSEGLRKRKIGVMGGTFDPIHFGHLVAGEEACFSLGLTEVVFVPTGDPFHKAGRTISSAEHRYTMTMLATLDNPHFRISRVEIDRETPSHTVDTLREMRHWYPAGSVEFYFITGLDAVLDIMAWKEPLEIPELCKIVAVSRPGFNPKGLDDLAEIIRENLIHLEIPLLAISSTEIRQRVSNGQSIRYLAPWLVEQYIYKNAMYFRNGW
ncbi:MAG TPA: nicotinic acid mononucleotide adenylyltransferase [Synergistaceae bacterium]|jgi:nicotinate-nucleotide adenylyltransferase|nr:MAG: putative nicotinate-nucleotide adenylyltransferase [Synergistales bacterium 57_84]KUK89122.1 MAG: putative nicotinate-nucleotide adenylyltransferase [Synergistales bacterium 58_81]HBG13832.1 nicotinic acid mononucleotide adenylyltransferase [Synergistaceae bacterium]HCP07840.1 nicotinic acid mononucleotide adenylyltransferase [Synergistaceae bacterium]HCR38098.1 nicotinic acid mononucleotide adenylyltransferase [Synergistaceae bacterium]